MKNLSNSQQIEMPLIIGSSQLKSHQKDITKICTLDNVMRLNIKIDCSLKGFIKNPSLSEQFNCKYKFNSSKQIQIYNQENQDLLELNTSINQLDNKFLLYKQSNSQHQFSFNVCLSETATKNKLQLKVSQQNITFQLIKLTSQIKFVRNKVLDNILSSSESLSKGLLTMDQSSRFLLESLTMSFPVIGFWLKTPLDLEDIQTIDHFVQFVQAKYQRRCIFKAQNTQKCKQKQRKEEKFFYFVRITEEKRMQTYIVSCNVRQPLTKEYFIKNSSKIIEIPIRSTTVFNPYDSIQSNGQYTPKQLSSISSSQNNSSKSSSQSQQQNGMDFTLREQKHKRQLSTLQSLINYSYLSPIKQLQSSQNPESLFSQTYQNSPQFSTLMKQESHSSTECIELRAKVKSQEEEIQKLKEIIAEMQSELKLYKNSRMSTHYESNRKKPQFTAGISSPESNTFSLGSNQNSQNNSPQVVGRLRESDLKSNSVSRSGDWLKNSSNKKSLHSRNENLSGSKQSDLIGKQVPSLLQREYREEKLYQKLPEIVEQDGRDPWDYMEIIED